MTKNYKPEVGYTVKATFKDNVLYGYVEDPDPDLPKSVRLVVDDFSYVLDLDENWLIEPWTPPVVFKPLAVVRLADDAFQWIDANDSLISEWSINKSPVFLRLSDDYWIQYGDTDAEVSDAPMAAILAAGKAEVLFAGVDQ